ncbi:unnamed protein product, partial [marine sediment metagenome]
LKTTYYVDVDDCIDKIVELYPDSRICYVDNQTQTHRVNGFDGEFTLDILNPPTAPVILIKTLLDLIPVEIMKKCGISPEYIRMIKDNKKVPIEREKEDVKLRVTQEDYASLADMRRETLSKYQYRESPFPKSQIDEIDIDDTTINAIRKIVDLVINGNDDWVMKEETIYSFHNLLNELDEIDFIDGSMVNRAIERVRSDIANDFSIVAQVRWQGRVLLFPGDLLNWNNIRHKVHSLDALKVPHHGGFGDFLEDSELLSRIFPTNRRFSIVPTCFPDNTCSTIRTRPDPERTMQKLHDYSMIISTSQFPNSYHDFVFDPD